MTNREETRIQVEAETLQYVQEYVYLGQNVSFLDNSNKEIKRRISIAWK